MADSFTASLNLRKPEVGAALSTWGTSLNGDMDLLDAVFLATGLGTSIGVHVGTGKVLNVEGTAKFADSTDITKIARLDSSLITTATTRTYQFPDENGVLATKTFLTNMVPTGTVWSGYYGNTAPTGFVFLDGRTIGDPTSGATNRANADTVNLFTLLWTITANAQCPVSGGRGASAAADYAAHKTLTLPNHSGRTMAGRDNLSGTAAGIWSGATVRAAAGGVQSTSATITGSGNASVNGTTAAQTFGQDAYCQAGSDAGPFSLNFHNHSMSFNAPVSVTSGSTAVFGVMQPTIAVDVIIAL